MVLRYLIASACPGLALLLITSLGRVDRDLSASDRHYVARMAEIYGFDPAPKERTFEEEIDFLAKVQAAVMDRATGDTGIPIGVGRNIAALFESRSGLCYDRSWAIQGILRESGFRTRHLFLYKHEGLDRLRGLALFRPGSPTHAMTEVRTSKGWMVVGSNSPWISMDRDGAPISMEEIGKMPVPATDRWDSRFAPFEPEIIQASFGFVYGLYSRHGMFHAPFVPIPDFNLAEILHNFLPEGG